MEEKPTEKQIRFVKKIAKYFETEIPKKFTKKAYRNYIAYYADVVNEMELEVTEKQLNFIYIICEKLEIPVPEDLNKDTARRFINNNIGEYKLACEVEKVEEDENEEDDE